MQSTSSVYGNNIEIPFKEIHTADHPIQFYAATKRSNELIAHAYSSLYKIETVGFKIFSQSTALGEDQIWHCLNLLKILSKKKIYIYNFGNHVRDFTYIDDIVNGIVLTTFSKKFLQKKISTQC